MDKQKKPSIAELDRDGLKKARNLMVLTAKTLKSMRIYPSNSAVIQDQKESLNREFQSFLEKNHALTIAISESGILTGDEKIYQNEAKSESLSFLLYKDGLREISFFEGMTGHELDDFLDTLAENWLVSEETDMVSSLWEKDFSDIRYLAIDDISASLEEPSHADSDETAAAARLSSGTITLKDGDSKQLKRTRSGSMKEIEASQTLPQAPNAVVLNDRDLEEIKKIVEEDGKFNPPRELAEALSEMLFLEEDPERYAHVLEVLEEYLSQLTSHSNFGMAYEVLRALIEFEDSPSDEPSRYRMLVETVLGHERDPESIGRIGQSLKKGSRASLNSLFDYVSLLGISAAPILIDMLTELKDPWIHSKARSLLAEFARADPAYFDRWLSDIRVVLVKQIIFILGQPGFEEATSHLEKCLRHQDVEVRLETVRTLSRIGEKAANSLLVRCLNDQHRDVRLLAVRSLNNPDLETVELVCSLVGHKEFTRESLIEKKAWVDLLRKTGSDRAVPVLRQLLNHRSWFRRRENNELKVCVASALGSIATKSAVQVLTEQTRSRNSDVKSACRHALRRAEEAGARRETGDIRSRPDQMAKEET